MIKRANNKHLEHIWEIEKRVFTKPWSKEQIKTEICKITNTENWIYLESNKVIGYILGCLVMDEYHLYNIAVDHDYHGNHIGKSLLLHVIQKLQKQSIKHILLEVSKSNLLAINLYHSLGFQYINIRRDYYDRGDHALLYCLDLANYGRMV